MGELLKFPAETTKKLGYRRVRKPCRRDVDPNQLDLFLPPIARMGEADTAPSLSAFERALQCDEHGDQQAAADLYARAIAENDCVADAYCNLAILESRRGNTARAFDGFTAALKHDPRHVEAHYNLACLYFELNDFRLAQLHYELTAEVDPTFANAYFNLGLVQSLNHDLAAAINTLTKYQELASPDEARHADELLRNLRQTLAAQNESHADGR
jgi:tetratricopeptide (TPR) repeat protein